VLTKKGVVCSASALSGAVGAQVLREGGNAFDAAIATAAAETVVLPSKCGIGGELFALIYEASTGKMYGVSGNGRAPMAASREFFIDKGYKQMPVEGPLSPSVPGEVHAWQTIAERFGTRHLGQLIRPAIELAEDGFPLAQHIARLFSESLGSAKVLADFPTSARVFLKEDGERYGPGDVLVQKDLARSLRRIAEGGAEEFYKGELAKEIAAGIAAAGGLIDEEDLAAQETIVYENPPSVEFHGHEVFATGLPSHGPLTLEIMSLLDGFDLAASGHNTVETIHTMVEAKRLAFADRLAYIGDPDFIDVPMDELLSKEYAAKRRAAVDTAHMADIVAAGELAYSGSHSESTSYFCVIDSQGNAVSFIHSLSTYFGSGFVPGETGILLNNRAGHCFSLDEGHPNVIASGKKTINTIHSYMVKKGGDLVFLGGTPGGDSQPQWNAQVMSNLIDHGMTVQEAADAPRWMHTPGTYPHGIDNPMELRLEDGIDQGVLDGLADLGHNILPYPRATVPGNVQLIAIDPGTGVHAGATDRRCDGYPIPE